MEKHIKKALLRWKLLPGCSLTELTRKNQYTKTRKLPLKKQITVKSTARRTQTNSLSITLPLALPLINYEEPVTKDVGTQNDNTLFELLDHYPLYHMDYSKNIKILELKVQEYSTHIQELK